MSDSPQLVRSLIAALRQAGGEDQATAFEHEFAARAWNVGPADYLALTGAIQQAVLAPRIPTPLAQTDVPEHLGKLAPFAPWVEVLPARWKLVDAMDAVLRASTTDELCRALGRVFVDVLGYEARGIDEHTRLGEQRTFTRLVWLAEHDGFHIVVAESRYAGRFTQSFDPVFRLRPYSIVFALENGSELRVVARQRTTGRGPRYPCRALRGLGLFGSFEDDLLTWCRRVALLQPQPRDDRDELRSRAEQCVLLSPSEIGAAWESGTVDLADLPGSGWSRSSAQAADLFLQPDVHAEQRLMVGLQFELRAAMPWHPRGGVAVHFGGYEILSAPEPIDTCVVRRQDRIALLRLNLVHESTSEGLGVRRVPFSVEAVVHVPDDHGVYCVGGDTMHHVPGFVPREGEPDGDDDDDEPEVDESDAEVEPAAQPDTPPETTPEGPTAESEATRVRPDDDDVYRGPSELTVLRLAVAKRLRTIGYVASQVTAETLATPELVRAWLSGRYGDGRGRLCLTAIGHLRRHLRRAVGPWRPIRLETEGRLPAWACPEAAAALVPGWAVPVAAARLGPGGVLVVPLTGADGRTKLVASAEDAFTINPRFHFGADAVATSTAGWVCEQWSHRAAAKLGELADFPGIARSAEVPLRIACVRAAESRFLLPSSNWPTVEVRRMWCVDLPLGRENAAPPTIRLVRGQRIAPGDVIATIDPSSWAPRARSDRHDVATQAAKVLPRDDDDDDDASLASSDEACVVRSPPGLAGRVARATWTVIHDRFCFPLFHRMTVETWLPVRPVAVRLRDGRRLAIAECASSDMPYSLEEGSTLDGLLEDSAWGVEPPLVEGDWIDGRTGDLFDELHAMGSVEFEYPELPVLPDPDLPARVLDGLGSPRSQDDARITQGKLRWWRATDPDAAASVDQAAARPHGWHASATSLYDLVVASHVRAPPIVPAQWGEPAERERVHTEHDPVRAARGYRHTRAGDRVDPITGHPSQQRYAPWAWSCSCGALRGEVRAFERCRGCDTRTEPRSRAGKLPPVGAIALGTVVVHPWRKPIVAALLGLRPDELDVILGAHDGAALAEATQLALAEPERSLLARLARSEDSKERESLSRGFEALTPIHRGRLQFEDLWLSELCLLPTRLLPDAMPMGATDLLASPLTRHYRLIAAAAGLVARATVAGETLLRTLTGVRLQRAIEELFGDLEEPSTGTLAELWRRLWPTTVDGQVEFAVPGLFRGCTVAELRGWEHGSVFGAPPTNPGDERIDLGILRDGEVIVLPLEGPTLGVAVSSATHEEREAWYWLTGPALPGLAAICLGVDVVPEVRAELGSALPEALEDSPDVGRVVLRELLRAVEPPRGRPSVLRRLLAGARAEVLPSERDAAMVVVRERVRAACGVRDPGTQLVEHALALVLTGFGKGPITEQCPSGWRGLLGREPPAPRHRRCVPRLGDAAWAAWPGFLLLNDPVRCAAEGRWNEPMSVGHRAWLGLDAPALPRAWWSEHEVEAIAAEFASSSPEPLASEPPTPILVPELDEPAAGHHDAFEVEIRVLSTSLNVWIAEHTSRSTNG